MRPIDAATAAVAIVAVAVPAFVVTRPPRIRHRTIAALPSPRIVPQAELPAVEPVRFVDLSPDEARAYNADVPFSTEANPAARPFRFAGSAEDRARAIDCMAAGTLYEAGDDTLGEKAVAQVVLNRLRHPAFPKTVCGVVFEGQERSTGCQFSFTCDGAVQRWYPTGEAWTRARDVATAALSGAVYRPVGYATHYHTDWVVPYWQSSLDKIAAVNTHLFFRWSGWWGTPPAFDRRPDGHEPMIAQLAPISDAHRPGGVGVTDDAVLADAWRALGFGADPDAAPVAAASDQTENILVTLGRADLPDTYPALAAKACGDRTSCRYLVWTDRTKAAATLPLTDAQITALAFSYSRDRTLAYETMAWNCVQTPRTDPAQCMKRPVVRVASPAPVPTPVAAELGGVRRKTGLTAGQPTASVEVPTTDAANKPVR
ncbi:cell wall hydrolase [Sphingomonas bacterium]|uniref:cell wall hydrolase n=1 Tax=Sphingomonas bacterium TaxID=1895847 RepID=UPI001576851A|nr:cell wall hydrolase [Sphingomonas bacterium]